MTTTNERINRYLDVKAIGRERKGCQCEDGNHSCELYDELSRLLKNANDRVRKEGLHRK